MHRRLLASIALALLGMAWAHAQTAGAGVPITVVVGDEERFSVADVIGLLDLPRKLERWQAGY